VNREILHVNHSRTPLNCCLHLACANKLLPIPKPPLEQSMIKPLIGMHPGVAKAPIIERVLIVDFYEAAETDAARHCELTSRRFPIRRWPEEQ